MISELERGWTWDNNGTIGIYTLTRRIWVGYDMTCLQLHRHIKEMLDTTHRVVWENIMLRLTDEAFEWDGEAYEIVGPGRLFGGSIIDRRSNDIIMYPCDIKDINQ